MPSPYIRRTVVARPACIAVAAGAAIGLAAASFAAPQGEQVVRGSARFSRDGATTVIHAADKTIINYRNFDIGAGETVRFVQPSARSRVLNRIDGAAPTRIDGALLANGQVYIVNPAGVIFGRSSIVDVAGIFAAAGSITDQDFLRNVNHFTDVTGPVVSDGLVNAKLAGFVGKSVVNGGAIVADGGMVTMVAGDDVLIGARGGRIFVRVDGAEADPAAAPATGGAAGSTASVESPGVANSGSISAPRGSVFLAAGDAYALAIRNTGAVSASAGHIALVAQDGAVSNTGSLTTSVDRGAAGDVAVRAPIVENTGAVTADAGQGRAGSVSLVSSSSTTLGSGSTVSASGGAGRASGGDVLVHSLQGDTLVLPGALVNISGGAIGGDGGTAEISAAGRLGVQGELRGDAKPGYKAASILFDPYDIVISSVPLPPGAPDDGQVADGTVNAGDSPGATFQISTGAIENFSGDVTLAATHDIFLGESLTKSNGGLTLTAGHNLYFSGEFDGTIPDVTATATFLRFTAANTFVDRNPLGTKLVSTVGDITLEATNGSLQFGLATVASGRTLRLTQRDSMYIGAGPFGIVGNRQNTNLVATVTGGWLIFGGDFGGVSGELPGNEQRLASVTATARDYVRVNDNMIVSGAVRLSSPGDVLLDGYVHAASLDFHGGTDGAGTVRFLSPGLDFSGDSIALRAGNNTGLATAMVDALTGAPTFRAAALGASRPNMFTIQQDASIASATLPLPGQFAAPIAGMHYRVESNDGAVAIADPARVAGSNLTLASATGSSIDADLSLASLLVEGTTRFNAGVVSTGTQTYTGAAALGTDAALTGSAIAFNATLDGPHNASLTGAVTFAGAVGGLDPLVSLSIQGPLALNGGGVTTTGGQTYSGPVALGADTALRSLQTGNIHLAGAIDGFHDLAVTTALAGRIIFGGDVGAVTALRDLRLSTAGGAPARPTPETATIVGERSLRFVLRDFAMGQGEKFTTLGSLVVDASRNAFLGDLVTQGDMTVSAQQISLLRRQPSTLLDFQGRLVSDRGLDFVAGGPINFNGAIALAGDAAAPDPTFSSAASSIAPPNLEQFEFTQIDPALVSTMQLMFDGTILDQRTTPATPPPPNGNDVAAALAGAVGPAPRPEDTVKPAPFSIAMLQRVAVDARNVRTGEAATYVSGSALYNDLAQDATLTDARLQPVATRFNIANVTAVVTTYNQLFGVGDASQTERVAGAIADAARSYMSLSQASRIDAPGFGAYLATAPDQRLALQYVQDLRLLLGQLRGMGLTPIEYAQTRDRLLAAVASPGLAVADLARVVDATAAPAEPAVNPGPAAGAGL